MARNHGAQIKDDKLYEALLEKGESRGKAARIANAHAAGTLHRNSIHLEARTVKELQAEAAKIGIAGRSKMNKAALMQAVRGHK